MKSVDDDDDVDDRPRTPIVTGPIIELRGREVLFAISVFFLTAIVVGLIVVLASNKVSQRTLVFYCAMLCIRGTSHGPVSVCPSQVDRVLSKRLNESNWFLACELPSTCPTLC